MKKQELIHLHGLLAEIGNYYEETTPAELDLDDYDSLGVRPTSIHKSKTDHKTAVFALADGITGAFESPERSETVSPSAD
ncbi:UPF0058 family protein [Halanaeroarchaeum sulfurireducens]|uniref:Metal-binding protein n=1 Tax=Halanaeroarchaeum sulfurireducens TaxID=1604004 RepID=A0A0F7PBL7_9EURY|nr:UPF0058 family protein [Halanaeroarchaeum sulfurireducens]AKH98087.1 hypothetical protein HLASF_1609 [Halanaeroarchaeum sulfurireducens]ALG82481.1 hypothetical protein HLASA_1596 [Halanaeroarchaeum sulfurireducens]